MTCKQQCHTKRSALKITEQVGALDVPMYILLTFFFQSEPEVIYLSNIVYPFPKNSPVFAVADTINSIVFLPLPLRLHRRRQMTTPGY